jgi:Uncharacterized protein conserved in bacteria (DUF2188)
VPSAANSLSELAFCFERWRAGWGCSAAGHRRLSLSAETKIMINSVSIQPFKLLRRLDMSNNDRTVFRRSDHTWVNKRNGTDRASSVHTTQKAAEDAAREMLRNQGGGELTTKGEDGRIRSKDTIKPAPDPNPPKDMEH